MIPALPPGLLLVLGGLLLPLIPGRLPRQLYLVLLPVLSFAQMVTLPPEAGELALAGFALDLWRPDALASVFGWAFHLALLIGVIYALHVEDPVQQVAAVVYAGGAISAVFAGDLVSLFVSWEVLALASAFLIWARRTPRALRAGLRYLAWQVCSGLLLLAGLLARYHTLGPQGLAFEALSLETTDGLLIFLAFGIKAAFPGLHTWLVDGYPEATPTGTVFLSAFTTKVAVYALARAFAGTEALIYIGVVMAAFPIFFAEIENDLRRVLSYSMINQVGFMVVGVGLGAPWGVNGAAAHAFADVIFKGLLFMCMGVVLQQTGRVKASELGGLYKSLRFTTLCCCVGAASIAAFPLTSAFATKSLVMEGVSAAHLTPVWLVLLFASAAVLNHAGIRIPFFGFFGYHDVGLRPAPPPWNMSVAMGFAALACLAIGCFPGRLYALLPHPVDYQPYTAYHVVTQVQLLLFSALAFTLLNLWGRYPAERDTINLDVDALWRLAGRASWGVLNGPLARAGERLTAFLLETLPAAVARGMTAAGPEGSETARGWAMGSSVLVIILVLALYLLFGGSV